MQSHKEGKCDFCNQQNTLLTVRVCEHRICYFDGRSCQESCPTKNVCKVACKVQCESCGKPNFLLQDVLRDFDRHTTFTCWNCKSEVNHHLNITPRGREYCFKQGCLDRGKSFCFDRHIIGIGIAGICDVGCKESGRIFSPPTPPEVIDSKCWDCGAIGECLLRIECRNIDCECSPPALCTACYEKRDKSN